MQSARTTVSVPSHQPPRAGAKDAAVAGYPASTPTGPAWTGIRRGIHRRARLCTAFSGSIFGLARTLA